MLKVSVVRYTIFKHVTSGLLSVEDVHKAISKGLVAMRYAFLAALEMSHLSA